VAYINVEMHSWLYDEVTTQYREIVSFLSRQKNPDNPSDDVYDEEHWQVRLETPKISVKLSDVINGLTKYSTFDITLFNNDGYFDNMEWFNFFNGPTYIRKTWKENPQAEDFVVIRAGKAESIKIDDKTMTVTNADFFRTLEEPVCKVVKDVFSASENADKSLPVVYGTVTIPLIKIGSLRYVAGENITSVSTVYDRDGNSISKSFSGGIITTSVEAEYVVVTGNTSNRIGQIVTDLIATKANLGYINSFWDVTETNRLV
jgi:hypothetical protein